MGTHCLTEALWAVPLLVDISKIGCFFIYVFGLAKLKRYFVGERAVFGSALLPFGLFGIVGALSSFLGGQVDFIISMERGF